MGDEPFIFPVLRGDGAAELTAIRAALEASDVAAGGHGPFANSYSGEVHLPQAFWNEATLSLAAAVGAAAPFRIQVCAVSVDAEGRWRPRGLLGRAVVVALAAPARVHVGAAADGRPPGRMKFRISTSLRGDGPRWIPVGADGADLAEYCVPAGSALVVPAARPFWVERAGGGAVRFREAATDSSYVRAFVRGTAPLAGKLPAVPTGKVRSRAYLEWLRARYPRVWKSGAARDIPRVAQVSMNTSSLATLFLAAWAPCTPSPSSSSV